MATLGEVRQRIEELTRAGHSEIVVSQSRRYIDFDAVKVGGVWYPIILNLYESERVAVRALDSKGVEPIECSWMDENGRAIVDEV